MPWPGSTATREACDRDPTGPGLGGRGATIAGEAWDGRDTTLAGARGVSDPVSRRGIRVEREGSEGPAPEPGRIQPGQFLVFTL